MIHQMWSAIHGRLYHSPLEDATLKRALDIGTGRGLWAMEFGMSLFLSQLISAPVPNVPCFVEALAHVLLPPYQLADIETAKSLQSISNFLRIGKH